MSIQDKYISISVKESVNNSVTFTDSICWKGFRLSDVVQNMKLVSRNSRWRCMNRKNNNEFSEQTKLHMQMKDFVNACEFLQVFYIIDLFPMHAS